MGTRLHCTGRDARAGALTVTALTGYFSTQPMSPARDQQRFVHPPQVLGTGSLGTGPDARPGGAHRGARGATGLPGRPAAGEPALQLASWVPRGIIGHALLIADMLPWTCDAMPRRLLLVKLFAAQRFPASRSRPYLASTFPASILSQLAGRSAHATANLHPLPLFCFAAGRARQHLARLLHVAIHSRL